MRIGAALRLVNDSSVGAAEEVLRQGTAMAAYCPAGAPSPSRHDSVYAVLVGVRTVGDQPRHRRRVLLDPPAAPSGTGRAQCAACSSGRLGRGGGKPTRIGLPTIHGTGGVPGAPGHAFDPVDGGR